MERLVELAEDLDPVGLALGDVVELLLHLRGEAHVHDVGEEVHQDVGDHHPDVLGEEPLVLEAHVAAVDAASRCRCVGRGPADPVLLERLDQARLGEARRRLGEVLLRQQLEQPEDLLGRECRAARFGVLVRRVVPALEVHATEPVELERLAGRPQHVVDLAVLGRGLDVHRRPGRIAPRPSARRPCAARSGGTALPGRGRARDCSSSGSRRAASDGWPRAPPARLAASSCSGAAARARTPSRTARDDVGDLLQRLFGDVDRVGPHIGDQADLSLARDVHALVQALRDLHRLARGETELAGRLLLQRGRSERRCRRPLDLAPGGPPGRGRRRRAAARRAPAPPPAWRAPGPSCPATRRASPRPPGSAGRGRRRLVAVRATGGRRRSSTRAATNASISRSRSTISRSATDCTRPADSVPPLQALLQQRRQLEADQPVQDPPRLLGVHQVEVDPPRLPERLLHGVARDLGEGHAVRRRAGRRRSTRPRATRWPRPRGRSRSRARGPSAP